LTGPLGSGKTTLVRGIAEGAGVADLRQVNSPTFVIVNEYESGHGNRDWRIHHIDVYRLRGSIDLEALGFEEMCSQGVVILEWADRVRDLLPSDVLGVTIESLGECARRFHFVDSGPLSANLVKSLSSLPC
jgi:tRNA threonylcarbamoyladenosine biosynthesis protein TsaE